MVFTDLTFKLIVNCYVSATQIAMLLRKLHNNTDALLFFYFVNISFGRNKPIT